MLRAAFTTPPNIAKIGASCRAALRSDTLKNLSQVNGGVLVRAMLWVAVGFLLTGCGGGDDKKVVEKPSRPNPFDGYARQIRYAKDWYRLSHHQRALIVAHWSHDAGLTKEQSNRIIWCLKSKAEANDAAATPFDKAKSACVARAKAKPKS